MKAIYQKPITNITLNTEEYKLARLMNLLKILRFTCHFLTICK